MTYGVFVNVFYLWIKRFFAVLCQNMHKKGWYVVII